MNEASESGSVLPGLEIAPTPLPPKADAAPAPPRVKAVNRTQTMMRVVAVEQLIEEDDPARAIWAFVGKLDLQPFYAPIEAVEGVAGRQPWDPRVLVCLWIYAYSRGIGSAREIARRCAYDPAFQWLTGMEEINYHTLSDFRVGHGDRLPEAVRASAGPFECGRFGEPGACHARWHQDQGVCGGGQFSAGREGAGAFGGGAPTS